MWERLNARLRDIQSSAGLPRPAQSVRRFRRIAIAGHTNVGKSSFLNALLGEDVATVRSRETTALPIMIRQGASRRRYLRRNGTTVSVGDEIGGTLDDLREPSWTGFIVELPRGYLRRYRLIDTPGIGGSMDAAQIYSVVRKCEVAFVLFNKHDKDMLSPFGHLADVPIVGIRTQADHPDDYDEERVLVRSAIEKAYGRGYPPPFIYVGIGPETLSLGNVLVPLLAERLDAVFQYRDVITTIRGLLDSIDRMWFDLEREEASVSVEHAEQVYQSWPRVKRELDRMKKSRVVALSPRDIAWLKSIIAVPIGRSAWDRVLLEFGPPPFDGATAPNEFDVVLRKWFARIEKRTRLPDRKDRFHSNVAVVRSELLVIAGLAGAILAMEFGDRRSARILRGRAEAAGVLRPATLRQYAPMLWEE